MYALYPIGKPRHFGPVEETEPPTLFMPPWTGAIMPPAMPGPGGHFDHLVPGTPQFECAHMYACARLTLGVWEGYFDRSMPWHFREHYDRWS